MYSFLGMQSFKDFCKNNYSFSIFICGRFYYPFGKPESQQQWETIVKSVSDFFLSLPNSQASKHHFGQIAKVSKITI